MKYILSIGASFVAPLVSLAHDEAGHIMTAWYQEPAGIAVILGTLIAVAFLLYGAVKSNRYYITVPVIALVLIGASYAGVATMSNTEHEPQLAVADFGAGQAVTLYKSPNCGCCTGHAQALEAAGFMVTIEETDNLDLVKQTHNIPADGASCHTSVIGEYVVEGHVPLESIEKLLTENPDIAGIGLAGMPIGTPGMPGRKVAPYEVYQITENGETAEYLTL